MTCVGLDCILALWPKGGLDPALASGIPGGRIVHWTCAHGSRGSFIDRPPDEPRLMRGQVQWSFRRPGGDRGHSSRANSKADFNDLSSSKSPQTRRRPTTATDPRDGRKSFDTGPVEKLWRCIQGEKKSKRPSVFGILACLVIIDPSTHAATGLRPVLGSGQAWARRGSHRRTAIHSPGVGVKNRPRCHEVRSLPSRN